MNARGQRGAALLTALLTVVLVASLASTALWRQWRSIEAERAERERAQMAWILQGALDWARLILREDARTSQVDHLSEPWALPLQEARLGSFLAAQASSQELDATQVMQAFLSGHMEDQQARLNVRNLVQEGRPDDASVRAFTRLFAQLNLPQDELQRLTASLLRQQAAPGVAQAPGEAATALPVLLPEQLHWLGLSPASLRVLRPHITVLPSPTPVNLNTAGIEVLMAVLPGLDLLRARQLVAQRAQSPFLNVQQAFDAAQLSPRAADSALCSVGSRYFAVQARLRLDSSVVEERSLLERNGLALRVVWRQAGVPQAGTASSLQ